MSTLYGESAVTDLFGSDIDLGEEVAAPPKKRRTRKSIKAQDPTENLRVRDDLEPYNWFIDDNHAPEAMQQENLVDALLPYYFLLREYPSIESKLFHPDSPLMQESGCDPDNLSASGLNPDSFFAELPDREDYSTDIDHKIATELKQQERLQAKKQCFSCPLQQMCAANSIIASTAIHEVQVNLLSPIDYDDEIQAQMKKSKSDDPIQQRKDALSTTRIQKLLRVAYSERKGEYQSNRMTGIFGGLTTYDRNLIIWDVEGQYDRYIEGKKAYNRGVVESDDDFNIKTMMTADEIRDIEKRMNLLYNEFAHYTY